MSDNKVLTTEEKVKHGIRRLLVDDVNTLLGGLCFHIPLLEFGTHSGREFAVPAVRLSACELTEKERIVFVNAYAVEITIPVDDLAEWDGELLMYTYGAAIRRAVRLNPSLGGWSLPDYVNIVKRPYPD